MAQLKLQDAIDIARKILNDFPAVAYKEEELLRFANDAINIVIKFRPLYFQKQVDYTCIANSALQILTFSDLFSLVNIIRIKNGTVVTRANKDALDRYYPSWQTLAPSSAIHWIPHETSHSKFYVYPPAPLGQVLEVVYVYTPPEFAANDDTPLPSAFANVISNYIVGIAMSKDDEHVNSGRAKMFLDMFYGQFS